MPEHFSYRWPKAYAAPLTSTKTVMKPLHGGNIARPMKVKELDEVRVRAKARVRARVRFKLRV